MAKANKVLQEAIDALVINDVYLHSSRAACLDDFDPKFFSGIDQLQVQQMHIVEQSMLLTLNGGQELLRVFIRMGTRWVQPVTEGEPDEKSEPQIKAIIEADFVAEYQVKTALSQVCIDAFSLQNASYHVWPYWREYLSSQCERMRLPRVVLPTWQVPRSNK